MLTQEYTPKTGTLFAPTLTISGRGQNSDACLQRSIAYVAICPIYGVTPLDGRTSEIRSQSGQTKVKNRPIT